MTDRALTEASAGWIADYLRGLDREGKDGAIVSFPMLDRLLAEHAALIAVARAARKIAEHEKAMIKLRAGKRWRNFISPHDAALIDALAALPAGLLDRQGGQ